MSAVARKSATSRSAEPTPFRQIAPEMVPAFEDPTSGRLDGSPVLRVYGPIAADIRRHLAWAASAFDQYDNGEIESEQLRHDVEGVLQRIARLTLAVESVEGLLRSRRASSVDVAKEAAQ